MQTIPGFLCSLKWHYTKNQPADIIVFVGKFLVEKSYANMFDFPTGL
jgi:hypothetical protein